MRYGHCCLFPISLWQSLFYMKPKWNIWWYKNITQLVYKEVKVKCALVQALRLCTGRTAHRGSRGIALLYHDHGTRMGWGVSLTPRPLFTSGKDLVPIVQEYKQVMKYKYCLIILELSLYSLCLRDHTTYGKSAPSNFLHSHSPNHFSLS